MSYNGDVIKYPREITVFAAVCAVVFCVLGIVGKYYLYLSHKKLIISHTKKIKLRTPTSNIVIIKEVFL